jgi:cell division protein FtsL
LTDSDCVARPNAFDYFRVAETGEQQMTKLLRSNKSEFSKREIALFVLVMIVATILTVEGTLFVVKTFVIGNGPVTKADELLMRKGK